MKEIELTRGRFAIVDDADFEIVNQHKWHYLDAGLGYASTSVAGVRTNMHNLLLGAPQVDHVNGDGLDNRRCNLRPSTQQENMYNRRKMKNNTSGYIGVSYDGKRNMFEASLRAGNRRVFFGRFATAEAAAVARDAAALKHHGEFARLNFPESA